MTSPRYTRREWLRTSALSAAGLALGACGAGSAGVGSGARPGGTTLYARPLSRGPYVAPRVSPEALVRTVAGLRPFRPAGFRVEAERRGDTLLVHNYGHGGGGVSLSWGSAALAIREAQGVETRRATVLGCGVLGLSTARLLQDRGWEVTIRARELPPHTTSNVAGALWGPTSVHDEEETPPGYDARFARAARISHHAFQNLVGAGYGVRWIEQLYLSDEPTPRSSYIRALPDLYRSVEELRPEEHPFPVAHARRITTLMIDPNVYLARLLADVRLAGGRVEVRGFTALEEVLALPDPVVFNCTGLGAGALFGDEGMVPIKGQTAFFAPDPAVDFATIGGGEGVTYMFPRADGILLGGTFQRGVSDLRPDEAETERMIEQHARLFGGMRTA